MVNSGRRRTITARKRRRILYRRKLFIYRFKIVLKLVFFLCCLVALVVFFNNFFKVKEISVNCAESFYKHEDFINASGVRSGENILFLNTAGIKRNIEEKLPFAKVSSVSKKFPNKLNLEVNKIDAFSAFEWDGKFVMTDASLKVLEIKENLDSSVILVAGIETLEPRPGFILNFKDENKKLFLNKLLKSLSESSLNSINKLDVSNLGDITMMYENRIFIKLGSGENIEQKVKAVAEILKNKLKSDDSGTLDLTLLSKNNRIYFMPSKNGKENSQQN